MSFKIKLIDNRKTELLKLQRDELKEKLKMKIQKPEIENEAEENRKSEEIIRLLENIDRV